MFCSAFPVPGPTPQWKPERGMWKKHARRQPVTPPSAPSTPPETSSAFDPLDAVVKALDAARRILVTTHVNTDGDAIGSSLALAQGLAHRGREVRVLLTDFAARYHFLDGAGQVEIAPRPPGPATFENIDLGVVLDASDPSRLGPLEEGFFRASFPRVCIDHHVGDRRREYAVHVVDTGAAATGSMILPLLERLGVPLSTTIAGALLVAIGTDTGWFRYANTSCAVLRDAARLVEAGANPESLYRRVYEQLSLPRVRLQGVILERLRIELDGKFVWSFLDRQTRDNCGVDRTELEGLIDPLRVITGVEVVAFLSESEAGTWKASLRSRGNFSVQHVASQLGGGGHARAAGCTVEGTLEEVVSAVRGEVERQLRAAGESFRAS